MERKKRKFFQKQHGVVKRAFCYILAFAMVVTMGTFSQLGGVVAKADDTTHLLVVHFNNEAGWTTVNAKFGSGSGWNEIPGYEEFKTGEFGKAISLDAVNSGWYTYKVVLPESVTQVNGLFNSGDWGSGKQTGNYSIDVAGDTEAWVTYSGKPEDNAVEVSGEKPTGWLNTLKVHFNNEAGWTTVNAKFGSGSSWNEIPGYEEFKTGEFGKAITPNADNDGWYTYVIGLSDDITQINGLFNSGDWGSGKQTGNYSIDVAGDKEAWVTYSGKPEDNAVGVSGEKPVDWVGDVLVAIVNGDAPEKYEGPAEITVHFRNNENWDEVYARLTDTAWNALAGYAYTATWPGAEVEPDSKNDGWYSFTINIDAQPINLILNNNNNGKQTETITITPTAAKTEKWVTGSTPTDEKPTGWTDSTSNPPVKPVIDLGYVSPEVDGRKVTFRYKSDTARTVQLAGTMTDWQENAVDMEKGEDDIWSVELQLSPGAYQYKFIVDESNWVLDPANENVAGGNSKVVVTSLADAKMYAEKGVETDLPTLKFYGEDGTLQNLAPASVNYELAESSQGDSSYVTIAGGKITVASGFTGKSVKLKATYGAYESTVTVNVVDKLYEYTIYYYDFTASHMNTNASALWIWSDGVAGTEYWFTGTEDLTKDGDTNTWLKATVKVPFTEMEIIPKAKSEDADAPEWTWQESQKHFENIDQNDTSTIYLINWKSTAYTELPELVPPRDRYVIVEFENPEDADDYEWNLYTWNNGLASETEIYPELMPDGTHCMTVPVADQDVDLLLSFCIRKCSEREANDWADQDGKDYYINVPADQTVVKAKYVLRNGVTEVYPYNTGYEMDGDNDRIHFYYRDDALFKACTLDTLDGKVQIVVNGGTPASMEYDAVNQRFYYDYEGLTTGDYEYYYLVNGGKVLDKFNPRTTGDGSASVLTYKVFDAGIAASVLNSTMDYNDNNVLAVEFTGADRQNISTEEIASIKADLSTLGFGSIDADPELMKVTIACLYSTPAGEKTIPVEVKDIYGHVYTADVKVTVTERVKAAGDFDWDEAVIYFAVTDRFFDGNTSNNDAYGIGDYNTGEKGGSSYHGGDFAGLTQKLDYLKELGVNTIWITPIVENITEDQHDPEHDFATYGYHGYWASDFTKLNQHLGTEAEFKALLDAAHSRNMKIMVDVVINHAGYGTESYFNTILPGDVKMLRDGTNTVSGSDVYASLSGLPDFVTENAAVRDQLVQWQTDWMDKFDIDYYRVDTVKHVDSTTWSAFKNSLTAVNPEFKMTGEYAGAGYASTAGMLETGRMDALLDFDFNGWAEDFVTGKISNIEQNLQNRNGAINNTSTMSSFLSSHDEDTLQALLVKEKKLSAQEAYNLMKVAATLQITAKGQPVIYYGEEIGQAGLNDWPYQTNRRDFDWAELERQKSDPNSIYNHYKTMLAIRNAYTDVFARGTRTTIDANDAEGYDIISRSYDGVTLYVGMNIKDTAKEVTIPVSAGKAGSAGAVYTNLYDGKQYTAAADGTVAVTIPAAKDGGTVVLVAEKSQPTPPAQQDPQKPQQPTQPTPSYNGWVGVSAEQMAKLMQESLAKNAAVAAPKTNDNAPIAMVIMLMMAGAVAVAGAVGKKRKLS